MLDPRAQPPALPPAPRELPRLPALVDNSLVVALAERGADANSPFGARLPNMAELIRDAIYDDPPTVLQRQYQRHVGQALTAIAAAAGKLAAAAGALSPLNAFNAFRQLGLRASEPGVVDGWAVNGAQPATYRLVVERLAAAQENVGALLPRDLPAGLAPGPHHVEVKARAGTAKIHVQVDPEASNEGLLSALAAAINEERLDLFATLARPTASLLQLVVTAQTSGLAGAFAFGPSPLVQWSGAGQVARAAEDAAYELNGVRTAAGGNEPRLQGGKVQLKLLRARPEAPVTVRVGPNTEAAFTAIRQLAAATTGFAKTADENRPALSPSLLRDFEETVQGLAARLSGIGLNVRPDNGIEIDESLLARSIEDDLASVEAAVAAPDGAAQRLGGFAAEVVSAPLSHVGAPELIPPVAPANAHPTPQMLLASNTLSALLYSRLFAQGLFINSLF